MAQPPSVIIASYNQPNSLALVFAGMLVQSHEVREVVVADDGSDADTRELVEGFAAKVSYPVHFETQEDRGFRKARALNNAIRRSSGEQLLFLDGDCVPAPDWVERYVGALQSGRAFATAGYVYLTLEQSRDLRVEQIADRRLHELCTTEQRRWFAKRHRLEVVYDLLRKRRKPHLKGGNWAATRECIYAVNGFDEAFDGVGKEDSDMRNRLRNASFRARSLWDCNWVYHCSHDLDPRRTRPEVVRGPPNREYYASRRRARWCERGLEQPQD